MSGEDRELIVGLLGQDEVLAKELKELYGELETLSHREMIRKEAIRIRMEEIGKARLGLFLERRKIYCKYEN